VGAKAEIQRLVLELAAQGKSIVFISSELEEVLRTSQRIVVMRDHRKVAEYPGGVDDHTIMQAMAGTA
jgi:simple sugar transport system ATP-binding protein